MDSVKFAVRLLLGCILCLGLVGAIGSEYRKGGWRRVFLFCASVAALIALINWSTDGPA